MEIGMIGLGKMGRNLAENFVDQGVSISAFDLHVTKDQNITFFDSYESLIANLPKPRIIWLMIPAGTPTNETIKKLTKLVDREDIIIDGGNSYYKDSIGNAALCESAGIHFLDCGTSGGTKGARHGACLMVGGNKEVFQSIEEQVFQKAAIKNGYKYVGSSGAGHYCKMVHNAIEYTMMQGIAEGFSLLDQSEYNFDLEAVAEVWQHGSIISGYLMDITKQILGDEETMRALNNQINSSGEGKWAAMEALRLEVPIPTINASLNVRYSSQQEEAISNRLVSSMRHTFGGHAIKNTKIG